MRSELRVYNAMPGSHPFFYSLSTGYRVRVCVCRGVSRDSTVRRIDDLFYNFWITCLLSLARHRVERIQYVEE